jgi:hypothetical protein
MPAGKIYTTPQGGFSHAAQAARNATGKLKGPECPDTETLRPFLRNEKKT